MNSGNTYRMRPDGSHAEYFTHGQVNPFGLAFDPLGNLYSCDCHSRPVYQLLRGAWYPSFGKPDDGLGFGPEMVTHDHGSTGIAGIAYYAADQFPAAYRDTVFIGNVVTNRINHDRIEWHGSSPKGIEQPDFVWSDDNWFRPVDIELGPDGALYVADFYNRIIGHYEVPLHPPRPRPRARPDLADRLPRDGRQARAAPAPIDRTRSARSRTRRRPRPSQPGGADLGGQPARRARRASRQRPQPFKQLMTPSHAGTPARPRPLGAQPRRQPRRRHADGLRGATPTASCACTPQGARRPPEPDAGRLEKLALDRPERRRRRSCAGPPPRCWAPIPPGEHPAAAGPAPSDAGRRYASDPRRADGPARSVEDGRCLVAARRRSNLTERDSPRHRRRRDRRSQSRGGRGVPAGPPREVRRAARPGCSGSSTTSPAMACRRSMPALVGAGRSAEKRMPAQRLELLKAIQQGAQERGRGARRSGVAAGSRRAGRPASGFVACRARSRSGIDVGPRLRVSRHAGLT